MNSLGAVVTDREQRALLDSVMPGGNNWLAFEIRGGGCLESCPYWQDCTQCGPQKRLCTERWGRVTASPAALKVVCHVLGNLHHYDRADVKDAAVLGKGRDLRASLCELLEEEQENAREAAIRRSTLKAAEKEQLIKARRGRGPYRSRVQEIEGKCRVTGVDSAHHLKAVHIKPWAVSSDRECLDGHNGLLLAPHVAHLFKRGYIGFSAAGYLIAARDVDPAVLRSWRIQPDLYVGRFSAKQREYLGYNRKNVFEKKYRGA